MQWREKLETENEDLTYVSLRPSCPFRAVGLVISPPGDPHLTGGTVSLPCNVDEKTGPDLTLQILLRALGRMGGAVGCGSWARLS